MLILKLLEMTHFSSASNAFVRYARVQTFLLHHFMNVTAIYLHCNKILVVTGPIYQTEIQNDKI